ncbi:MAG: hypothetical protein AB8G11_23055 [Saprospiraceae bacterium]
MLNYIKYYLKAKTKNNTKSAFAKTFLEEIWEDDRYYYAFDDMKGLAFWLKQFKKKTPWQGKEIAVNDIYHQLKVSKDIGQRLFYFARTFEYKNILEIGGGLNGVWMLQAIANSTLHIIEPHELWASLLQSYVNNQDWQTAVTNSRTLDSIVNMKTILPSIDVVIIDLKVQHNDTVATFVEVLTYLEEDSVIIITNKHIGNTSIWEMAKSHPKTKLTLDFHQIGFVFFKNENVSIQHLELIHNSLKPWSR